MRPPTPKILSIYFQRWFHDIGVATPRHIPQVRIRKPVMANSLRLEANPKLMTLIRK